MNLDQMMDRLRQMDPIALAFLMVVGLIILMSATVRIGDE